MRVLSEDDCSTKIPSQFDFPRVNETGQFPRLVVTPFSPSKILVKLGCLTASRSHRPGKQPSLVTLWAKVIESLAYSAAKPQDCLLHSAPSQGTLRPWRGLWGGNNVVTPNPAS